MPPSGEAGRPCSGCTTAPGERDPRQADRTAHGICSDAVVMREHRVTVGRSSPQVVVSLRSVPHDHRVPVLSEGVTAVLTRRDRHVELGKSCPPQERAGGKGAHTQAAQRADEDRRRADDDLMAALGELRGRCDERQYVSPAPGCNDEDSHHRTWTSDAIDSSQRDRRRRSGLTRDIAARRNDSRNASRPP